MQSLMAEKACLSSNNMVGLLPHNDIKIQRYSLLYFTEPQSASSVLWAHLPSKAWEQSSKQRNTNISTFTKGLKTMTAFMMRVKERESFIQVTFLSVKQAPTSV